VQLWLANLFTPMFGQRDWQGRIISFVMRLVQLMGRTIGFCVWVVASFALLVVWVLALPVIFYGIVSSFLNLFA
jgi:hypothetical protein